MKYSPKDYSYLKSITDGFSEEQLRLHFKLYEGYVKSLNEIESKLEKADRGESNYTYGDFTELKRRFAVAFNGMALHELYFENLTQPGTSPSKKVLRLFDETWGSQSDWETDLKATGIAGPGWVITGYNPRTKTLQNILVHEHHVGWPVRFEPILVMDMWEHAFAIDFGIDKAEYISVFLENTNWDLVSERLNIISDRYQYAKDPSPRELSAAA